MASHPIIRAGGGRRGRNCAKTGGQCRTLAVVSGDGGDEEAIRIRAGGRRWSGVGESEGALSRNDSRKTSVKLYKIRSNLAKVC